MKNKEIDTCTCLPEAFVEKMRGLLGPEAEAFFESYEESRQYGLRLNPLKTEGEIPADFLALRKIPWVSEGRYYEEDMRPGKHPLHEAGLYYIQEPSAMAVAEALAPHPGERILDLCAAPGGKSTHIAGKLNGKGLLVCNEIHPARAKILSQNIERMGIGNAVVTNMEPAGLLMSFQGFFDGIVVDAPCSGEGMFRKDENARAEWSPAHVTLCADRQDGILDCAAKMVRPGGRIAYSTCTFSPEENEQTIARFLERHGDFSLMQPACADFFSEGRPEWADGREELRKTVRIWPHKVDGEGHFLALLVRAGTPEEASWGKEKTARRGKAADRDRRFGSGGRGRESGKGGQGGGLMEPEEFRAFCEETLAGCADLSEGRRFLLFGENLYLIPQEMPGLQGLKVLRPGLHAGTLKKGRFEPSHALALFLKRSQVRQTVELGEGVLAEKYLRGETILEEEAVAEAAYLERDGCGVPDFMAPTAGKELKGWTLMTVCGYSIGWAKAAGGVLKNHYPKGLRRLG